MTYTELFTELVRAEIELWDSLDARLRETAGLTLPTFQALSAVSALPGAARVQDISETMSITVGATSKLVDRLERDGRVSREPNPDDRRSSLVVLTPSGSASLAAAASAAEQHLASILGPEYPARRAAALTAELAALRELVLAVAA
jgi:DNA-binding MarR family transcriptional regulator